MLRRTTLLALVAACSPREHEADAPGPPEDGCRSAELGPRATPADPPAPDPAAPASAPAPERCVGVPSPALARAKEPPTICCLPDRAQIQRTIEGHRPRLKACFEEGLRRDPALAGRLRVRFAIEPGGEVVQACALPASLPDAATIDCVLRAFTDLRFPGYSEAKCGPPTITYPLELRPR